MCAVKRRMDRQGVDSFFPSSFGASSTKTKRKTNSPVILELDKTREVSFLYLPTEFYEFTILFPNILLSLLLLPEAQKLPF